MGGSSRWNRRVGCTDPESVGHWIAELTGCWARSEPVAQMHSAASRQGAMRRRHLPFGAGISLLNHFVQVASVYVKPVACNSLRARVRYVSLAALLARGNSRGHHRVSLFV